MRAARRLIRERTRAPSYWAAADKLSHLWLGGPLRVEPELVLAAGPDLAAVLDSLYEELLHEELLLSGEASLEALPELTLRLQEMATLEGASRELLRYETGAREPGPGLEDAARATLAVLTTRGQASLLGRGAPGLASLWLEAWAAAVRAHDVQQQQVCGLGVLARLPPAQRPRALARLGLRPEALLPASTSFSEGVSEFLDRYGETGASSVAILGVLPFSALPLEEVEGLLRLCTGPGSLLPPVAALFRLAQDVSFDPSEAMNTGVFASAAEQRRDVPGLIAEGHLSKEALDARLRKEWSFHLDRTRRALEETVAAQRHGATAAMLATWLSALFQLLERLVPGTWKT